VHQVGNYCIVNSWCTVRKKSNICVYYKSARHTNSRNSVTRTWGLLKNSYISVAAIYIQNGLVTLCHYITISELSVRYYNIFSLWKEEILCRTSETCQLTHGFVVQQGEAKCVQNVTEACHVVLWHAQLFCEIQGLTVYVAVGRNHHINYSQIGCTFQHV